MGLCIFNLNFAFLLGCPQIIDKHPYHVFRRLLHWKKGKILLSPNLLYCLQRNPTGIKLFYAKQQKNVLSIMQVDLHCSFWITISLFMCVHTLIAKSLSFSNFVADNNKIPQTWRVEEFRREELHYHNAQKEI